jgi:hypothetical protein
MPRNRQPGEPGHARRQLVKEALEPCLVPPKLLLADPLASQNDKDDQVSLPLGSSTTVAGYQGAPTQRRSFR